MKKILLFMFGVLLFNIVIINANAESITLSGDKEFSGSTFTISFSIETTSQIETIVFPVSYDKEKVTLDKSSGENGFNIELYKNIVLDGDAKSGKFKVATLTFKATDNFKVGESTTITFGDGEFADDKQITKVKGTSITIKKVASATDDDEDKTPSTDTDSDNKTPSTDTDSDNKTPSTDTDSDNKTPSTDTDSDNKTPSTDTDSDNKTPSTDTDSDNKTPNDNKNDSSSSNNNLKDDQNSDKNEEKVEQVDTGSGFPLWIILLFAISAFIINKIKSSKKLHKI